MKLFLVAFAVTCAAFVTFPIRADFITVTQGYTTVGVTNYPEPPAAPWDTPDYRFHVLGNTWIDDVLRTHSVSAGGNSSTSTTHYRMIDANTVEFTNTWDLRRGPNAPYGNAASGGASLWFVANVDGLSYKIEGEMTNSNGFTHSVTTLYDRTGPVESRPFDQGLNLYNENGDNITFVDAHGRGNEGVLINGHTYDFYRTYDTFFDRVGGDEGAEAFVTTRLTITYNPQAVAVPEPTSFALLSIAGLGLAVGRSRWRNRSKQSAASE